MKHLFSIFIGFAALLLSGCAGSELDLNASACIFTGTLISGRVGVRNGDPAPNCASGSIVFISSVLQSGDRYDCTGTLIRPNVVLTAAHCIADPSVRLTNTTYVSVPGVPNDILASKRVANPGYNPTGTNTNGLDVALIFLSNSVPQVAPAQISSSVPPVGAQVAVYGYGYDGRNPDGSVARDGDGNFGSLLTGSGSVVAYYNDPSYRGSAPMGILTRANTPKNQETCQGDSGGPLIYNGQVVGILSGGDATNATCLGSTNSAYTSVAAVSTWISSTISSQGL